MEVRWTVPIPQAMQRHTGCVWVKPVAERRDDKTKVEEPPRVPAEDERAAAANR